MPYGKSQFSLEGQYNKRILVRAKISRNFLTNQVRTKRNRLKLTHVKILRRESSKHLKEAWILG